MTLHGDINARLILPCQISLSMVFRNPPYSRYNSMSIRGGRTGPYDSDDSHIINLIKMEMEYQRKLSARNGATQM